MLLDSVLSNSEFLSYWFQSHSVICHSCSCPVFRFYHFSRLLLSWIRSRVGFNHSGFSRLKYGLDSVRDFSSPPLARYMVLHSATRGARYGSTFRHQGHGIRFHIPPPGVRDMVPPFTTGVHPPLRVPGAAPGISVISRQ